MIEIVALFFLCRKNGELASRKGLKRGTWIWYTIWAWIVAELTGMVFALAVFGQDNLTAIFSIALVSAFGGYLFIRNILDKKPDPLEEEINRIGVDDLQPPVK